MGDRRREQARHPAEVGRLFVARANAGDAEGLAELYESGAVLVQPSGDLLAGNPAILEYYEVLLTGTPTFDPGQQRPPLQVGELALTSTRLVDGSITVEVARRQRDGTWKWVIDQPNILR